MDKPSIIAACISVQGWEAQIQDGYWVSEDPVLEALLNSLEPPSGSFPYQLWRDLKWAERAAAELGGTVLWCAVPPTDTHPYPPDAVS